MLYKSGIQVASLVFNVASTNNLNWFPQNKLVQSPWSDLKAATNLETFNIDGVARYFDISSRYGFGHKAKLALGKSPSYTEHFYSKLGSKVNWNDFGMYIVALIGFKNDFLIYIAHTLDPEISKRYTWTYRQKDTNTLQ